jgi:hypothetical protein
MPRHHSAVPRLSASPCRARSRVHLAAEMVQQLREAELEAEALRASMQEASWWCHSLPPRPPGRKASGLS